MLRTLSLFTLLTLAVTESLAQDARYVSDKQYIPLRSGPGGDYRIVHRGIPSGTSLKVARESDDGTWAEITTAAGTSGWIRTQYLMDEVPAKNLLRAAEQQAEQAVASSTALKEQLASLESDRVELLNQINSTDSGFKQVSEELNQLKQVSGKAVQLDTDNRRLVEESENLRSEADMLKSENQRLQDKLDSEAFIDGALAVFLGVIITLVVPRLWPKRRKSSSWA
ncbi:MAG: TIGR04211 family SH3 domain-containing protein [Halieaceae bacterium]